MSRASPSEIERALAELRADYAKGLEARVAEVRDAASRAAAERTPAAIEAAARAAHRLCGASGSYGFTAISEAAGRIERVFDAARDGEAIDCDDAVAALDAAFERERA